MARSRREFTPDYKDEAVKLVITTGKARERRSQGSLLTRGRFARRVNGLGQYRLS